jgi:hypothetical protein
MNSRMWLSSSMAPSSLVKVMALRQAGQENVATTLVGLPLDPVGGAKKFPSKTCPETHSHRLNDESSSSNGDNFELAWTSEQPRH